MTPFAVKTRGRRTLRVALVRSGYEIAYQRIVADPDKPTVTVSLKKASYPRATDRNKRGILRVICRSRDKSRIFLNGKDTGYSCPKVGYFLAPGTYEVGLFSLNTGKLQKHKARIKSRDRSILRMYRLRKYRRRRRR